MKKNVLIIASAAKEGGALSILTESLNNLKILNIHFTVVVNPSVVKYLPVANNIKYHMVDTSAWIKRIAYDFYGYPGLKYEEYIACINFQNIPIRTKIKQIVYYHQSLPLSDTLFSPFNKETRVLYLYQKFYGLFFKLNKRYISHLVVQANWIREKISGKFGVENNKIEVIAPQVEIFKYISLEFNKIRPVENVFFYPANAYTYKNHLIIIKALNYLGSVYIKKHRIKVVFTINNSESNYLQSMVLNYNLQDVVSFIGRIPRADVYSLLIKSKALLFPSKLETYGLPLKEARQLGVFIVASKLDYATEVLEGYEYKRLCSPDSAKEWASAIKEIIENKIDVGNTVTRDNIKESDLFSDFIKSKIME